MRWPLLLIFLIFTGCAPHGVAVTSRPQPTTAVAVVASEAADVPLPAIAIFTAIVIFLAREALDWKRRENAKIRKIQAIKSYLARQCEFNNYSLRTLRRALSEMKDSIEMQFNDKWEALFLRNGKIRLNTIHSDGQKSGRMIPNIRINEFESRLMDVAELNGEFQKLLDDAATASAEMQHVKDSLLSYILKEDGKSAEIDDGFFEPFLDYGISELDESFIALDKLYIYCTGKKKLEDMRLR